MEAIDNDLFQSDSVQPIATVIIPTRNRKDLLLETLRTIALQPLPLQVIVLDDGSTDGTPEMVEREMPHVELVRSDISRGPAYRRNQGAQRAKAPILFTIDDDCVVPSSHTFRQTLEAFNHSRVGAVTLPFVNVRIDTVTNFSAVDRNEVWVDAMYYGGMVAFRREAFLAVGGYRPYYFIQAEEPDLAIRLLDAGYIVRLGWADPVHHLESPIRNLRFRHMQGPRNLVLYEWYNAPLPQLLWRLPIVTVAMLMLTIKLGCPHLGLLGLLRGYAGMFHEFRKRQPVRHATYRLYRRLRRKSLPLKEIDALLPPQRSGREELRME